jgi:anti-sigma factor RsiW
VIAHLKPEQSSDLILGSADKETMAHLAACPQCQAEIETLRQALAEFRTAAINWSADAAQQVSLPKVLPGAQQKKLLAFPAWARPAWALTAAAVVLAVVLPFAIRRQQRRGAASDAQAQIARDNQLLAHIDSEIGETTPTPMQPLQMTLQTAQ